MDENMSITEVSPASASKGAEQQALARHFKQRASASGSRAEAAKASDAQSAANRATSELSAIEANRDDETYSRTQWA